MPVYENSRYVLRRTWYGRRYAYDQRTGCRHDIRSLVRRLEDATARLEAYTRSEDAELAELDELRRKLAAVTRAGVWMSQSDGLWAWELGCNSEWEEPRFGTAVEAQRALIEKALSYFGDTADDPAAD